MIGALLLLDLNPRTDNNEWIDAWFACTGENLVLAPQFRHDGILIVLSEKDSADKLPEYIENEDGTFDDVPLYVIWDETSDKRCVHKYAPFENSVRQLVQEFKP